MRKEKPEIEEVTPQPVPANRNFNVARDVSDLYNANELAEYVNLTWTEAEKEMLLAALQKYGLTDLSKVASEIPNKSVNDVKFAIGLYERAAIRSLKPENQNGIVRKAPVDRWMEYLKHVAPVSCKESRDVATTLKIIAAFEKQGSTNDVNLRDCYEYLAAVTTGTVPKKLSDETMYYFMTTFAKIAMRIKNDNLDKEYAFLDNLVTSDIAKKMYSNKNSSISGDPILNALRVPPHLLKMKND